MVNLLRKLANRTLWLINRLLEPLTGLVLLRRPPIIERLYLKPYNRIRVAQLGETSTFESVANVIDIEQLSPEEWNRQSGTGFGLCLIEMNGTYKLSDRAKRRITELQKVKLPIFVLIQHLDSIGQAVKLEPDYFIVFDKEVAMQASTIPKSKLILLEPAIDPRIFRPVGWQAEVNDTMPVYVPKNYGADGISQTNKYSVTDDISKLENIANESKQSLCAITPASSFSNPNTFIFYTLALAASGTPVLVPAEAENQAAPPWAKILPAEEITSEIKRLSDREYRERVSITNRDFVLEKHNLTDRFEQILKNTDLELNHQPFISVITSTIRPHKIDEIFKNIDKQRNVRKELVLLLHGEDFDFKDIERKAKAQPFDVQILHRRENSLFGDNLQLAAKLCRGEYVAKMDDDDYYGANHLFDLQLAFTYADAAVVGKWSTFVYFEEKNKTISAQPFRQERYSTHLPGCTFMIRKHLLDAYGFGSVRRSIDSELFKRLLKDGLILYSTHRYNFARIRHDSHTWSQEDDFFFNLATGNQYDGFPEDLINI